MIIPSKPFNQLMPLPPKGINFDNIEILKLSNKASRALARLDGQISSAYRNYANALNLIKAFTVPEAVASSAVENIVTTVSEALQARALSESEVGVAQKETNKYTEALSFGSALLNDKGFLATNDYIRIQKALDLPATGLRKLSGYKIANEITGEVYYTPPEGEIRIRQLLKDFEDYFNSSDDDPDPLIRMALLHYQFEAIHPFPDGNGRIGRILMPLYLVKQGYLRFPVLFLSEYILTRKSEYYENLRAVTYKGSWEEWVVYILKGVIEQADKTSQALDKIQAATLIFERAFPESIPSARKTDVINFVFTEIAFSREHFANELGIGINTASAYLNILQKDKLLSAVWHQRKKVFYQPRLVRILSANQ